jgi:dolichol-phosphate mannosyltransferase
MHKKNSLNWLLLGGLVALSLLLRFVFYTKTNLLVEEAYYWNYGQHLAFGYLDHPPMVGALIRLSTELLGNTEWAVRLPALLCWVLEVYFSVKLTERIAPGAGCYTILLLALLPFFFLQSLVITPDQPLLACWSASLYYLHSALVRHEARAWLKLGVACGLGLFSKYTIVLLAPATLIYMLFVTESRRWLRRPEPYVAAVMAMICFLPVIYWNMTHDWASFAFQSSRRFNEPGRFSLYMIIGLLIFFLTPVGIRGFIRLFQQNNQRFLQVFTAFPLLFFSVFSLTHPVKFNWIGPSLLAVVPWLARLLHDGTKTLWRYWLWTLLVLCVVYSGVIAVIGYGVTFNLPSRLSSALLVKFIDWEQLTKKMIAISDQTEQATGIHPVWLPLDRYNIASELAFYQAKLARPKPYAISGSHVFGDESLMYRYWSDPRSLYGKNLVLISDNPSLLDNPLIKQRSNALSPVRSFWTFTQGSVIPIRLFYYQLVQLLKP